jgi:predicted nucleic acid-binding protein
MLILVLDSSVIFDLFRKRFGGPELLRQLVRDGFALACCPVNITEVYAGLRAGEEDETAALLSSLLCLPVTPEIARQAGLLRRDWQRKGHTLQAPLLTGNRKHFPMPELQLWPLPPRPF